MPRMLDLFCGAGGATRGYQLAGFEVWGVDINPQPNYCGDVFFPSDVFRFLNVYPLDGFDAIHASPPCQMFTAYRRAMPDRGDDQYVNLIPETRALLEAWGGPYVIENVPGAPLVDPIMCCGSMFDPPLEVQRHRLFETNWGCAPPAWPCRHKLWGPDRYPGGASVKRTGSSKGLVRGTVEIGAWDIPAEVQHRAIGIDWMPIKALSQAIPPAYTEHIGRQLIHHLEVLAA